MSLFVLLAVVFAVGSAFTTFEDSYRIFANTLTESWGTEVPGSTQPDKAQTADASSTPLSEVLPDQPSSTELDEMQSLLCDIDDILCFVVVKYEDEVPVEIVDFRDGEFIE